MRLARAAIPTPRPFCLVQGTEPARVHSTQHFNQQELCERRHDTVEGESATAKNFLSFLKEFIIHGTNKLKSRKEKTAEWGSLKHRVSRQ